MMKLNGTVTLSILDEDNSQRVIFRIIPLCTKDGLIFQNRKAQYPDYGSLRIIPDKREQSSFKERMREIGKLCCVQLFSEGKELTKVRQNRNYDPNQGENNQYAIYSDVICGFEDDSVFEVFQEGEDYSASLTDAILLQRGKVLYGPVAKDCEVRWETLKPFGNEKFLLQTVEDIDGSSRIYYWNPEAIVTWRQRKRLMKRNAQEPTEQPQAKTAPQPEPPAPVKEDDNEQIPIGTKLDILNTEKTTQEHISGLNMPISNEANLLETTKIHKRPDAPVDVPHFHGTPIADAQKNGNHAKQHNGFVHGVVQRQIKEHQSTQAGQHTEQRYMEDPVENLESAVQRVWQIPALQNSLLRVLEDHKEIARAIKESPVLSGTGKHVSAAQAELDVIEAERISLLVELDRVKADYQQTKDKMYSELAKQKRDDITGMETQLNVLREEKKTLEETLSRIGDRAQTAALDLFAQNATMLLSSDGSDTTIAPTLGFDTDRFEIVETVRSTMSDIGFMCKQDCVTEFMIFLSLYDEVCMYGTQLWESELYIKNVLRALGLLNVTGWPSASSTLHLVSLLPENELRTPTVEVFQQERTPLKAYGHKAIHLVEQSGLKDAGVLPVIRVPKLNKARGQDKLTGSGRPISLQTVHGFTKKADLLHKDGEAWFDTLKTKLEAEDIQLPAEVYQAMRVFARIATPQVVGGFTEAADAATLAWVVPRLIVRKYPKDKLPDLIGELPRSMYVMSEEPY